MSQITTQMREKISEAIGAWSESLEVKVKEQLKVVKLAEKVPLINTDDIVRRVMIEFGTFVGALIIYAVEEKPNHRVENQAYFGALSKYSIPGIVEKEKVFEAGAIKSIVDSKERISQNLNPNHPIILNTAKKLNLTPQQVLPFFVKDIADQQTQAVRSVVPLVFKVAQETWSIAEFDERLTKAFEGDSVQKKKWWQSRK